MRLKKLYDVFVLNTDGSAPSAAKKADAFAELVQCLDDKCFSLVIRESRDDGPEALKILRRYYQGKGKPRVITIYTELDTLKQTDYQSNVENDCSQRSEKHRRSCKRSIANRYGSERSIK